MRPTQTQEDSIAFDVIRIIAVYMVVLQHVAAIILGQYGQISDGQWWVANIFYTVSKSAVPLFILISGALLLDPAKVDEPIRTFFSKRFNRIAIPFIFWSAAFYIWLRLSRTPQQDLSLQEFGQLFWNDQIIYHLWFFYVLIALYLVVPILRVYMQHATRANLRYFLGLWFVVGIILPSLRILPAEPFYLTVDWMGVFVLGYYLRDVKLGWFHGILAVIVYIAQLVFVAGFGAFMTERQGFVDIFYWNELRPYSLIGIVALFLILKSINWQWLPSGLARFWAQATFGIYLFHAMLLDTLFTGRLPFTETILYDNPAYWIIPLTTSIIALISTLIIMLIIKIPIVKHIA